MSRLHARLVLRIIELLGVEGREVKMRRRETNLQGGGEEAGRGSRASRLAAAQEQPESLGLHLALVQVSCFLQVGHDGDDGHGGGGVGRTNGVDDGSL